MSRTYSICCHDCEIELWIGQSPDSDSGRMSRFYIYNDDRKVMAKLAEFLMDHKGHSLGFNDDEFLPDYDRWEEHDGNWVLIEATTPLTN